MLSWYDHGYFQDDLIVWWCRHEDGRNGLRRSKATISGLFFKQGESGGKDAVFSLAFSSALEESYWVESVDPATSTTYYYNIRTEVSAWELPTVDDGEEETNSEETNTNEMSSHVSEVQRAYHYEDVDQWYYKDHADVEQGPFHADEMRAWMDAGKLGWWYCGGGIGIVWYCGGIVVVLCGLVVWYYIVWYYIVWYCIVLVLVEGAHTMDKKNRQLPHSSLFPPPPPHVHRLFYISIVCSNWQFRSLSIVAKYV